MAAYNGTSHDALIDDLCEAITPVVMEACASIADPRQRHMVETVAVSEAFGDVALRFLRAASGTIPDAATLAVFMASAPWTETAQHAIERAKREK